MDVADLYARKPDAYFGNARRDIVALLPAGASDVLEIGCGAGGTGAAAKAAGRAGRYVAIELDPDAARAARQVLDEVVCGNVETVDLAPFAGRFDVLIVSEVLEHLVDPWAALARLRPCLRPGGRLFASSPNAANWLMVRHLLRGRFDYEDSGVMDRTHLRWFTPGTYRAMVEDAGFAVDDVVPLRQPGAKARLFNRVTGGRYAHLFYTQMMAIARAA